MFTKVTLSLALLFALVGGYNMVWKDRLWLGIPIRTRNVNLSFCCFLCAVLALITGYLFQ